MVTLFVLLNFCEEEGFAGFILWLIFIPVWVVIDMILCGAIIEMWKAFIGIFI